MNLFAGRGRTLMAAAIVVAGCLGAGCAKKSEQEIVPGTIDTFSVISDTPPISYDTLADIIENMNHDIDIPFIPKCEPSGRVEAIYAQPFVYRNLKRTDIGNVSNITGLFCENDKCYLRPARISFSDGVDECTNIPTLTLKSNALFLFLSFIDHNEDSIQSISLGKDLNDDRGETMPPNKKFAFELGNVMYELNAVGEKINDDEQDVENYSLLFSIKGTIGSDTLVSIKRIRYAVVKLLFIGDLDSDGKPDIILDAPLNYENNNILLFLSSTAKKGKHLKCEGQKINYFDC
ncbi:hypothetical protein R80B4_01301 [Fibrobacteres bacterium R8-0-B4]